MIHDPSKDWGVCCSPFTWDNHYGFRCVYLIEMLLCCSQCHVFWVFAFWVRMSIWSMSWPVSLLQIFNKHNPENTKGQQAFLAYGGSMSPTTRSAPCTARASKRQPAPAAVNYSDLPKITLKGWWNMLLHIYKSVEMHKNLEDALRFLQQFLERNNVPLLETPDYFHMRPKSIGYRLKAGFRNLQKSSLAAPFLSLCWHDVSWFSEISWDGFPSDTVPSNFNLATRAWKLLPVWNETVGFWNEMFLIHDLTSRCHFGCISFLKGIYILYHHK